VYIGSSSGTAILIEDGLMPDVTGRDFIHEAMASQSDRL
jgi:hypothetical protein